ncbi:MAG: DivIVA domain-containing protein [Oscillospiraceae bacterium]|nr:DivIVA domain-containing protein [Oscillospiraceae bacterium]
MFTPKELQEKSFDKAVFGGYDMQMVDEFLAPLTEDYITLYKENSVLKSKMKILVEKLEEYREQELSMKKALVAAQQTSDNMVAEAQKKASRILNDAETEAQSREASLRQEFAAEAQRVQRAKDTAQAFITRLEGDVQQHLQLLEELKRLDLSPASAVPEAIKPLQASTPLPDLATKIGNTVQEIAGSILDDPASQQDSKQDFRFENLQFGKDFSFTK